MVLKKMMLVIKKNWSRLFKVYFLEQECSEIKEKMFCYILLGNLLLNY